MSGCPHDSDSFDIVCKHVAEGDRQPLYVWRYKDNGQLGYNCGFDDHPEGESYVPLCSHCGAELLTKWGVPKVDPGYEAWKADLNETAWQLRHMSGADT